MRDFPDPCVCQITPLFSLRSLTRLDAFDGFMHRAELLISGYFLDDTAVDRFEHSEVLHDVEEVFLGKQPCDENLLRGWLRPNLLSGERVRILPLQKMLHVRGDCADPSPCPDGWKPSSGCSERVSPHPRHRDGISAICISKELVNPCFHRIGDIG